MASDDKQTSAARDEIEISDEARAGIGPDSWVQPGDVTLRPLEREMGETADLVTAEGMEHTVATGEEMTADERERRGIIDESRHPGSMGTR